MVEKHDKTGFKRGPGRPRVSEGEKKRQVKFYLEPGFLEVFNTLYQLVGEPHMSRNDFLKVCIYRGMADHIRVLDKLASGEMISEYMDGKFVLFTKEQWKASYGENVLYNDRL